MAPIHFAASNGNLQRVRALLNLGTAKNAKDMYGWTPLTHAAYFGHVAVGKELINRGASINARETNTGWTALIRAAQQGHLAFVRLLLNRGANTTGVMNRSINENTKNFIRKHKAGVKIASIRKGQLARRRIAANRRAPLKNLTEYVFHPNRVSRMIKKYGNNWQNHI